MKAFDIVKLFAFAFVVALVAVAMLSHSIKPLVAGLVISIAMVILSGFFDDEDDI